MNSRPKKCGGWSRSVDYDGLVVVGVVAGAAAVGGGDSDAWTMIADGRNYSGVAQIVIGLR